MSDSDPRSHESRRGGFWSFWSTLPGVLTGAAALITAIAGILSLRDGAGDDVVDRGPEDVQSSTSVASASREAPPLPGSTAPGIFTQGRITMRSVDNVDLEEGIVGNPPGIDLYLHCSGIDCILNAMRSLLTVADGATDKASCMDALRARRDQALTLEELRPGRTLCIQTEDGHVGALQIVGVPGVGSTEFVFTYTLWR